MDVSSLDTNALAREMKERSWAAKLMHEVMRFGRIELSSAVYVSKLVEDNE